MSPLDDKDRKRLEDMRAELDQILGPRKETKPPVVGNAVKTGALGLIGGLRKAKNLVACKIEDAKDAIIETAADQAEHMKRQQLKKEARRQLDKEIDEKLTEQYGNDGHCGPKP